MQKINQVHRQHKTSVIVIILMNFKEHKSTEYIIFAAITTGKCKTRSYLERLGSIRLYMKYINTFALIDAYTLPL